MLYAAALINDALSDQICLKEVKFNKPTGWTEGTLVFMSIAGTP